MRNDDPICVVCGSKTLGFFDSKILNKHSITYYRCLNCKLVQTERPNYWLKEAYSSAIIDSDTGIMSRNMALSKITTIICLLFSVKNSRVLDYGGGYGILTRMLRDIGIDCYWVDKYAENVFAKGFEGKIKTRYDVVTAFELFEHLEKPIKEIGGIIKRYKPKILLFSTMVHDGNPPKNWWYFAPEGGQHITLYTEKSLEILAKKIGMKFSTNGRNIHVFSKKHTPKLLMKSVSIFWPFFSLIFPLFFRSKTFDDRVKVAISK